MEWRGQANTQREEKHLSNEKANMQVETPDASFVQVYRSTLSRAASNHPCAIAQMLESDFIKIPTVHEDRDFSISKSIHNSLMLILYVKTYRQPQK